MWVEDEELCGIEDIAVNRYKYQWVRFQSGTNIMSIWQLFCTSAAWSLGAVFD
jgi:hypothetical protein